MAAICRVKRLTAETIPTTRSVIPTLRASGPYSFIALTDALPVAFGSVGGATVSASISA
ncbi:hypothetical protein ThimaDRAFT_0825 [Thiocapsa marina 5811]|uniref:Uncharacterized protein n=1 Tax=Thiocapsa marina 5811 TaxID=768671 RepID=F9U7C3_9GAMM|nr:hypothetical protein ThimaDRAFT_0825 [Thiocapsa marina 5811]